VVKGNFQDTAIILLIALLAVLLISVLTACGVPPENTTTNNADVNDIDTSLVGFETVYSMYESATVGVDENNRDKQSGVWVYYLREKLTNVMYVWRTTGREHNTGGYSYWSSGMTVLMDPNTAGPMMYNDWVRYMRQQHNASPEYTDIAPKS
jgi:hypothetical protein